MRGVKSFLLWVGCGVFVVLGTVLIDKNFLKKGDFLTASVSTSYTRNSEPAYISSIQRNALSTGIPGLQFTDNQIQTIAKNVSIIHIAKHHGGFDIEKQFEDTRRIVSAVNALGNEIGVYAYYNATFWFYKHNGPHNTSYGWSNGWGTYFDGFKEEWYLKDRDGNFITPNDNSAPGYVIDLTNPDYRAYAVATIVDWMNKAP